MSDIDRAELRRLLAEAPPGPWRYREYGYPRPILVVSAGSLRSDL